MHRPDPDALLAPMQAEETQPSQVMCGSMLTQHAPQNAQLGVTGMAALRLACRSWVASSRGGLSRRKRLKFDS